MAVRHECPANLASFERQLKPFLQVPEFVAPIFSIPVSSANPFTANIAIVADSYRRRCRFRITTSPGYTVAGRWSASTLAPVPRF
jgi:hypothetical protein